MADSRYFVDVFGEIVDDVRSEYDPTTTTYNSPEKEPYYIYGHPTEIANRLSQKNDGSEKFEKYPLIALFQDFKEKHGESLVLDYTLPFSILILAKTEASYTSEERYTNTFKTVLYPLYELLLKYIARSQYIYENDKNRIDHEKIDRLYWGKVGIYGNEGLIFNDKLDAIEVNFNGIDVIRNINSCQ